LKYVFKSHFSSNIFHQKKKPQPAPYVAFLQGKDNHSCGGFLVAPAWVMTAAQCLQ
uniref:Peptidase S1 domain-containing protein n=1 Tax=Zonotrichia albicollis TaxID=44394 RepID=A0A8D2NEF4_ZONAL